MNDKLKKCPFCKGEAEIRETDRWPRSGKYKGKGIVGYSPVCTNFECVIYDADDKYFYSEAEAITAWNRRAGDAQEEASNENNNN